LFDAFDEGSELICPSCGEKLIIGFEETEEEGHYYNEIYFYSKYKTELNY
jgi:hypothetical protein